MKKVLSLVFVLALVLAIPALSTTVYSPETPVPPPEIEEIIEELQTTYRLTIYYIYLDGSTAAPTYTEQLDTGTEYNVPSPEIPGYTPTIPVVRGVMPARDVEYTVIYIPTDDPDNYTPFISINEYETPLGLGTIIMNVGVCIE